AMRSRLAALAPYAVLTAIGAIVVVTPYLAYYADHSLEANGRVNQVSIFASGWLEREAEATGRGEASIVMHRIWDCLLLPFHGFVHGFYRPGAPYVGEDLAIPVAIGIGVAVAGFWRRRYVGILITYAAVAGGLAITEGGLYQSNRYSGVVVLFSLLTAVGLGSVLRVLSRLVGAPAQVVLGGLALALGLIGAWNVDFYFRDDNQVELYSDPNTQIANTLAYELLAMEPAPTVYFVGPPQMWYGGFANIEYIVPEAVGITIEEPLTAADQPPELTGTTLYVFLPFRIDEYETVRGWFPGGEFREVLDEAGALLYYEYRVEPGQTGEPSGVYGN
ncbi:MAG: hypothetical protein IT336_14075, partial [Thermomicrobiales bacterium]|nr:hypothetical protein [Thermomicrobiales bacterium]